MWHSDQGSSTDASTSPPQMLLFGGDLVVRHADGEIIMDEWIRMVGAARVLVLIKRLRGVLDAAIRLKLADPSTDLRDHPAFRALLAVLEFE
jgi:hypothetical protein